MLMEREELAGPDYHPIHANLQKWAHEDSSVYIGDQKVKISSPCLCDVESGEVDLKSYKKMREHG